MIAVRALLVTGFRERQYLLVVLQKQNKQSKISKREKTSRLLIPLRIPVNWAMLFLCRFSLQAVVLAAGDLRQAAAPSDFD